MFIYIICSYFSVTLVFYVRSNVENTHLALSISLRDLVHS